MKLSTLSNPIRLGLAAATLFTAAALAPAARAEEWTKSFPVSARPQVSIDTNDGAVHIYTSDTKQVEFKVEYHGYTLDKDLRIVPRQNGDRIELEAKITSHGGWCIFCAGSTNGLRIEVRMPKDADLTVHTGDGSVEAQPITGSVRIDTGDGSISLEGAKGEIRLHSGDGSINARDLDGRLQVTTGDGSLRVTGRFDALDLTTGDGSIDARANPGSKVVAPWNIHTGDGSVDLALPEGLAANVNAQTSDGHITIGFPITIESGDISTSHVSGKINGGGTTLNIQTGDGSIRIRRA